MTKFDYKKWVVENKYGKLPEDADPSKQDDTRFPTKLSSVDKEKASAYVDQGDFDGEKDDDTISKESSSWPVTALKPSQSSMNIEKALAFAIHMMAKKGPFTSGPGGDLDAFVSSDMHIMDGHHRWIASGMVDPGASLGGHKINYPAMKLVAVLNTLTKGEFNVTTGKAATGGFNQFQEEPVRAQLEKYLAAGVWNMTSEDVQSAIEQFTGVQGEGAKQAAVAKFVSNLSSLKFKLPPGAPSREDMPVIDGGDVATAIDKITTGDIDVNPPYGDGYLEDIPVEDKPRSNKMNKKLKELKLSTIIKEKISNRLQEATSISTFSDDEIINIFDQLKDKPWSDIYKRFEKEIMARNLDTSYNQDITDLEDFYSGKRPEGMNEMYENPLPTSNLERFAIAIKKSVDSPERFTINAHTIISEPGDEFKYGSYAVEEAWGPIANILGLDFEGEEYGRDTYDKIDKLLLALRNKKLIDLEW